MDERPILILSPRHHGLILSDLRKWLSTQLAAQNEAVEYTQIR
jgi:hypothetical protein